MVGADLGKIVVLCVLLFCSQVTTTLIEPRNELEACGRIPLQEDDGACHRRDSPRSAEFSGSSGQFVADKDSHKTVSVSPRFTFSSIAF